MLGASQIGKSKYLSYLTKKVSEDNSNCTLTDSNITGRSSDF